jgi:F-type H+-transporting ATPase subunit b
MNIMPNLLLIALQLVPFLVTITSLYFIIFKPMMTYLDEREDVSSGAADEAQNLEGKTKERKAEINVKIDAALKSASLTRSAARQELVNDYNNFVLEHRQNAEKEIKAASQKIAVEKAAVRQEIRVQAEGFAAEIAAKIVGRNIA